MLPPDLTSPRFKANSYPFYARLRAEAPVYRIRWIFGLGAWIVARYDDVLTVLKDARFSKVYIRTIPFVPRSLEPLTRNLVNLDPPDHTRVKVFPTCRCLKGSPCRCRLGADEPRQARMGDSFSQTVVIRFNL